MTDILRVLSVGVADSGNTVRDALLQRDHCHLSAAANYRELFAISKQESFDIAILHHIHSAPEFDACSEYVRRTWPRARILVMCTKDQVPDDPLYDDWVAPGASADALLTTIWRLVAESEKYKAKKR